MKESKIIHWQKNLWKANCRSFFSFILFIYSVSEINSHGIDYIQYDLIVFNFQFTWTIRRN